MNPNARKFRIRPCVVCGYKFSDAHHLYPRNKGGTKKIFLCPNHHRYANMLQVIIGDGGSRIDIAEEFAKEHFEEQFNEKLLQFLVSHYAYGLVSEELLFMFGEV